MRNCQEEYSSGFIKIMNEFCTIVSQLSKPWLQFAVSQLFIKNKVMVLLSLEEKFLDRFPTSNYARVFVQVRMDCIPFDSRGQTKDVIFQL
jgi:hypothetical protein